MKAAIWTLLVAMTFGAGTARAQPERAPASVEGPAACGECHESSVDAWRTSHHFKTFKELPRRDKAREIADALGIKRIKSESECLGCHYTTKIEDGDEKAVAGISCESCHGAGKDWIDVHSDFGGKDLTAEDETPEHREERWRKAEAAGMVRPGNLYDLAANCYGCHTVPNERLVNEGGHPAGSDFELVAWTQGEVRHNLWYNEGSENAEASIERRRKMYLLGHMVDLEFALRGVAEATVKDEYALAMAKRAQRAAKALQQVMASKNVLSVEVAQVLRTASKVSVSLNNRDALIAAADRIRRFAREFVDTPANETFRWIDGFLPPAEDYQGTPYQP